ncbi:MAG: LamG-like jellyroll fold domain-containing protein [Ardenticatenales bacterium]
MSGPVSSRLGFRYVRALTLILFVSLCLSLPVAAAAPRAPERPASAAVAARAQGNGPTARALAIESEYDALRVPDDPALSPRQALTIEMWVKRRHATGCAALLSKSRADGWWFGVCDGRLRFGSGGASVDGNAVLAEARWIHVAVAFDGATAAFYVDGELDRSASMPGVLGRVAAPLVIGADATPGAVFSGGIDHVRLWGTARSGADIRADRYATLSARSGLIAQWPLDGDGRDLAGGHDGEPSTGAYSFDGALPRDLVVPLAEAGAVADGVCGAAEYGTAERVALDGVDALTALVQATADALWVCVPDLPRPTGANAFVAVELDRNRSADARVQLGDYRILARYSGTHGVEEGDGLGGWRALTLPADAWTVGRTTTGSLGTERWTAEIRIARTLLEPPRDADEPVGVGLAIAYSGLRAAGDDRLWPSGATLLAPAGWSNATLAEAPGLLPRFAFSGTVVQPTADDPLRGEAGSTVQLLTAATIDGGPLRLVDSDVTDGGGVYRLAYRGYPPAAFVVRQLNARGMRSVAADPGARGRAGGADVLHYVVDASGSAAERTFTGGRFVDAVGLAPPAALDRHYLIVYGAPVTEADLAPLVRMRRAQGFQVSMRSIEDLERNGQGRDLGERIQSWLAATWRAVEPDPVYALLVGRGDVIPVRDIAWQDNDHRDPLRGDYYPAWPTDWVYADVDSDWDADGDGYYGEFMRCRPGDTYPDADGKADHDCPEAGSLSREGPFGELRGSADDYHAEIALGRLPLNEPAEVRRAIATIVAAETGGADRRRALLAGAMWSWEGDGWSSERAASVPGGDISSDPWLRAPWDGLQPFGVDAADALEAAVRPRLSGPMTEIRRLYTTLSPDGDPALSPTTQTADGPLTAASFMQEWSRGLGLAVVAGRGAADGVYGGNWTADYDGDRRIDQPAAPSSCPDPTASADGCSELAIERLLDARLPQAAGSPLVIAHAGGTAGVAWTWDGVDANGAVVGLRYGPPTVASTLMGRGRVAGWVGSYGPLEPGDLDSFQAGLVQSLVVDGHRLGDAHGAAAGDLARRAPYDPRHYGTVAFGDPAQLYWGDAADAFGPWPGDGGGWRADGASSYAGPNVPEIAWVARDFGPGTPASIGRQGDLMAVGSAGAVLLTPGGATVRQTTIGTIGGAARFAPAIGVGGAYVAAGGTLLNLGADLTQRASIVLPAGGLASGAPRLDPDGVVWVPTSAGLVRVGPAGDTTIVHPASVVGAPALLPTGEIVWSTGDGTVLALSTTDFEHTPRVLSSGVLGAITSPAVSPSGTVFVGTSGGRIIAYPNERTGWQMDAGGAVNARPSVAADGKVVAGTARGDVVAFAAERAERLWITRLNAPIDASIAVDGRQAYAVAGGTLFALDLATGATVWTVDLDGVTDARSAPVIGADRTVYVTRADRGIVAIREAGWLAAPSNVRLTAAVGALNVAWRDNSTGETGFMVELCDADETCAPVGTTAADATQLDVRRLPFDAGRIVTARVWALGQPAGGGVTVLAEARRMADAVDASEIAMSDPAAVPPGRPATPAAVTVDATGPGQLTVRWRYDADSGLLLGFTVARRDGASWQTVGVVGADTRMFVDGDLPDNAAADYRVTAETEDGTVDSGPVTGTTWRGDGGAPRSLRATESGAGLLLTWRNRSTLYSGVQVERLDPGMARFQVVARLSANSQRFLDHYALVAGTYTYRIRATDETLAGSPALLTVQVGHSHPSAVYLPFAATYRAR